MREREVKRRDALDEPPFALTTLSVVDVELVVVVGLKNYVPPVGNAVKLLQP